MSLNRSVEIDDLGSINPAAINEHQRDILLTYVENSGLFAGDVVPAGEYEFSVDDEDGVSFYKLNLTTDFQYLGEIDPTHYVDDTKKAIKHFLRDGTFTSGEYMPANVYNARNKHGMNQVFYINKSILVREKVAGSLRFDVVDTEANLDSGAFGTISQINGTFKFDRHNKKKFIFKSSEKRVAKVQEHDNTDEVSHTRRAENELALTKKVSYLSPRGMFYKKYDDTEIISAMTLKKLEGQSLFDFLSQGLTSLTTDDRFQISLALLSALLRIHNLGLVHRDIKPENIHIYRDPNTNFWKIKILDFGLAANKGKSFGSSCGSFKYCAQEVFKKQTSEKSDLWAMARVIGLIWGDDDMVDNLNLDDEDYYEKINKANWVIPFKLFADVKGLSSDIADEINYLLTDATNPSVSMRIDTNNALYRLLGIYNTYQDSLLTKPEQTALRKARTSGMQLRVSAQDLLLDDVTSIKNVYQARFDGITASQGCAKAFIKALNMDQVADFSSLNDISDHIDFMAEKHLDAKNMSDALYSKLDMLVKSYHKGSNNYQQEVAVDLNVYAAEIQKFHEKIKLVPANLDDLAKLTKKIARKNAKIANAIVYFSRRTGIETVSNNAGSSHTKVGHFGV